MPPAPVVSPLSAQQTVMRIHRAAPQRLAPINVPARGAFEPALRTAAPPEPMQDEIRFAETFPQGANLQEPSKTRNLTSSSVSTNVSHTLTSLSLVSLPSIPDANPGNATSCSVTSSLDLFSRSPNKTGQTCNHTPVVSNMVANPAQTQSSDGSKALLPRVHHCFFPNSRTTPVTTAAPAFTEADIAPPPVRANGSQSASPSDSSTVSQSKQPALRTRSPSPITSTMVAPQSASSGKRDRSSSSSGRPSANRYRTSDGPFQGPGADAADIALLTEPDDFLSEIQAPPRPMAPNLRRLRPFGRVQRRP